MILHKIFPDRLHFQSVKFIFKFSQTFGPWQFTSSWPTFNFQSPNFHIFSALGINVNYTHIVLQLASNKKKREIQFLLWGQKYHVMMCSILDFIFMSAFIDLSDQRQLKVHGPPHFFIAFVRCLQANFVHCTFYEARYPVQ